MTLPSLEHYGGREQAYVKHYFLASYLERLVHKVAHSFDEVVYVDGFSGPWQNADEQFSDTSFGIALDALRTAKVSWQKQGRTVTMRAVLVEKNQVAFDTLATLPPRFPDVKIQPIHADFRTSVPSILAALPRNAFAFVLIDPLGWRVPVKALEPLLRRPNTEILFNFMFDFINRAASMAAPATVAGLDELLPTEGWRESLAAIAQDASLTSRPKQRKDVLIDAFREVLRDLGGYRFIADVEVLRPIKDRILYSLVYATRSEKGIEVFRDSQIKTLVEQEIVRGATKVTTSASLSGQEDMFGTHQGLAPDATKGYLNAQKQAAEGALLELLGTAITWGEVWPLILERFAVRRPDLNAIAGRLKIEGKLTFDRWTPRKRVPDDDYIVSVAHALGS